MHIEPEVVTGAKLVFSYATAAGALGLAVRMGLESVRKDGGAPVLAIRGLICTALVFCFFEVFPHYPVGVSEVHIILGSTLLLLFGGGATAIGLAAGLLLQGVLFAPSDLPQYGMNVTTLLVPLWAINALSNRVIPAHTAYVNLRYGQVLALSATYQGGIVAWVAFWALYGQGFEAQNLSAIGSFGVAYMSVVLLEPIIALGILAGAKAYRRLSHRPVFSARLHNAA
ncbi:MAG: energy-coupling factor ABC transporter permease [Pseudomonadota bacterium]